MDCQLTASGSDPEQQTTCHLTIAVGAKNRQPRAWIASSPCRTVQTLKLTTAAARDALRARGAELAGKTVGVFSLERTAATAVRGLAEWTRIGPAKSREECFALMEATLRAPADVSVAVIETSCEAVPLL